MSVIELALLQDGEERCQIGERELLSNLSSFPYCIFFMYLVELCQSTCFGYYQAESNVYSGWMMDFFLPPVSFYVKPCSVMYWVFFYGEKTDMKFNAENVLFLLF